MDEENAMLWQKRIASLQADSFPSSLHIIWNEVSMNKEHRTK